MQMRFQRLFYPKKKFFFSNELGLRSVKKVAKGEGYLPWACVHLDYLSPTAGGGRSFTRGKGISSVRSGYTSHSSSNTTRKPSVCKQRFTHRKGGGGYGFFFFFFFFFSLSTALCVRPMEWSTGVVWASHKKVSAGEQHQVGSARKPRQLPLCFHSERTCVASLSDSNCCCLAFGFTSNVHWLLNITQFDFLFLFRSHLQQRVPCSQLVSLRTCRRVHQHVVHVIRLDFH